MKTAASADTASDPRLITRERGVRGYFRELGGRARDGDLSSAPVVAGLAALWITFQALDTAFLSPRNLSNLSVDIAGMGLIAVGIVFVLLVGDIDLSVGAVSGLCGAVFAVLNVNNGMAEWLAAVLAVLFGAAVGAVHGFFVARVGVPAFVVTLAGLLAWNGLMLQILGPSGTINIDDEGLVAMLTNHYFGGAAPAFGVAAVAVAGYFLVSWRQARRGASAGLPNRPFGEIVARTGVLAVLVCAAAWVLTAFQGLPLALMIFLAVVVGLDFVLRRTSYGRAILALGGGMEAARRAGLNVPGVRLSVFMIAGVMAAIGGLFLASRIASVSQTSGSGSLLINVIAAAVIGGTSLFGGRGSTWSALLGVLVIQSIASGMALLGIQVAVQFMITGGVLLAAVVVDSLSRHLRKARGRA
ncbi:sugar ABC transporter permease [Streptomyces sp. NBC_01803]|uniref:sugar ABC transporter permease n=1 Tax=Streptomyces sp. NBC_01803 TaxID=2975946 RepID=UPI002DDBCB41|nr:sugar ABC transporter permease [Streptomyces sp. NBC_01803]WSA45022.1 sugar ABC transporter permease [Streptomyces sp. NBC_01803]